MAVDETQERRRFKSLLAMLSKESGYTGLGITYS